MGDRFLIRASGANFRTVEEFDSDTYDNESYLRADDRTSNVTFSSLPFSIHVLEL